MYSAVFLCYSCGCKFTKALKDDYPYCSDCGSGRTAYKDGSTWVSNVTGKVVLVEGLS